VEMGKTGWRCCEHATFGSAGYAHVCLGLRAARQSKRLGWRDAFGPHTPPSRQTILVGRSWSALAGGDIRMPLRFTQPKEEACFLATPA
jgi:hypothetical protein